MPRASLPGNLPAESTSFIGRRRELAELRRRLTTTRLVSLVGPGGVGKTRLAVRLGTDLARSVAGGAWLVGLAEVQDPALVAGAALAALDLRDQTVSDPMSVLLTHLRDKEVLLIVDNCEHLLDAAAQLVAAVIDGAPGVRVIATSREPLSVAGEHVLPVPPLDLPPAHAAEPLALMQQNEAVMLFVSRAAAASGSFALTASNQAAVADVCRRLDGLPLAIELAAVRTRVLTAEQILARLSDRFALLTGGSRAALPRHQTLRTAIEWSHELLPPPERALLRRLCVFGGRFTLDDAEAVCAPDGVDVPSVLDLLSSLVDKSLVIKEDAARVACYRLHETMREYARLQMRDAGEEEGVESRCAGYFRMRLRQGMPGARYRLAEWLEWLDLEIDNVRRVLRRHVSNGEVSHGIEVASALGWFWITRATTEGARWFDELLAAGDATPRWMARANYMRGFLGIGQADPAAAKPALDRAIAAARIAGDASLLSQCLAMGSIATNMAGDAAEGTRMVEEAQSVGAGLGHHPTSIMLLQAVAMNALFHGDLDTVGGASADGIRFSREAGDMYALEHMLMNRGSWSLLSGDLNGARPVYVESLRIARDIDDRVAQYYLLDALGCLVARSRQWQLAARLLGAGQAVQLGAGAGVLGFLTPLIAETHEMLVAALGAARFAAEFDAGARMSRDDAIALALGEPVAAGATPPTDGGATVLGAREMEVARLVAEGFSNKVIGARLFISERTVESHVRSMLSKLGFTSRTQVASWIASSDA